MVEDEACSLELNLEQSFDLQSLFASIDAWEKESIARIQFTARNARSDLQQIINQTRDRVVSMYNDRMTHLRSSYENNNLLNQWMKQFKQLQATILSILSVRSQSSNIDGMQTSLAEDRFSKVIGGATLHDDGHLVKHSTEDWNYEYLLGENLYFQGQHTIHFKLEQNGIPYNIFLGCISSRAIESRISIQSSFTVGWFGNNQIYQHGLRHTDSRVHHYTSTNFATNDILRLTIDCDRNQIELFHEQSKKKHLLRVNLTQAPFPWQLLMILTDKDDRVRILPSSNSHSSQHNNPTDSLIE